MTTKKKAVAKKANKPRKGDSKITPKAKVKVPVKKIRSPSSDKWRTESRVERHFEQVNDDHQLVLAFPGTIEPMALILHPALEIGEWAPLGIKLRQVREWLQFAIGDWLNHGEAHYGEMYSQAATDTGLPEETLMILKYVSSRVEPERRIKDLTWSHHREVAKFPPEEQTRWLEMALQEHWSVRDLKEALKKAAGKDRDRQEGREEGPPTGEACAACGGSPASMKCCGSCMAVASKAIATVGTRGAIELLNRKPSKPQLEMLKWAYDYIDQPETFDSEEAEANWVARYDALGKVAKKAA